MTTKSSIKPQETIVLSVGGSLVAPDGGINVAFLKQFNLFIRKHIKKGRKFFIVVGGGKTARHYRDAGKAVIGELTSHDLDWLGIHATRLNAHLIRTIFQDIAHPRIIENYEKKLVGWQEPLVVGSGWKPGHSTDYDAVLLARDYHASAIVNMSDIDCVYNADPKKDKNAKPINKITWDAFQKIVGNTWSPGINAPFDPIASQLAKKLALTVIIANGNNFTNLDNILNGERFIGTMITPITVDAAYYDHEYYAGQKSQKGNPVYSKSSFGGVVEDITYKYRASWIKKNIDPRTCLDIGCGMGQLVGELRKKNIDARGIEISTYALEKASVNVKDYLSFGDIVDIPYDDNSFDLVVSYDVLEHLERSHLQRAIKESIRVSRRWVLHKVYTRENKWIHFLHDKDHSQRSVLTQEYWLNLFKYIPNVAVSKKGMRIHSLLETLFLLEKNPQSAVAV